MDVDELIERAWKAVEKAGVPEPVQGVGFKEAINFLRDEEGGSGGGSSSAGSESTKRKHSATNRSRNGSTTSDAQSTEVVPDEDTFFAQLANESGVDERTYETSCSTRTAASPSRRPLGRSATPRPRRRRSLSRSSRAPAQRV